MHYFNKIWFIKFNTTYLRIGLILQIIKTFSMTNLNWDHLPNLKNISIKYEILTSASSIHKKRKKLQKN
jgi:hypothetical protein